MTLPYYPTLDDDEKPQAFIKYDGDDSSFVFTIQDREVLRLCRDGKVFVHGDEVGDNHDAFDVLEKFFKNQKSTTH
jgi:hypothetical protein